MKLVENETKVLGYQLKTKIGAGSYGEVWRAEAPGGLAKALKFVYGFHDEKRAQTELRSLDLIKELRHPFLLSLERFEVFEGQLVIVSELADFCLNTRLHQCIDNGQEGIERTELVRYMREAAEALDYISAQHKLQHLDVKPENILLVSGHVKVADFGLVKQIKESSQSLLSGLTPAYAPPELFDGRPSVFSDQYSLALVFHEMLTGYRVFNGTTTAQLAAQHLSSQPDLSRLPHFDQSVIAKALSKDPTKRFDTCCELVDGLDRSGPSNRKKRKRTSQRPPQPRNETTTDVNVDQTNTVPPEYVSVNTKKLVKSLKPPKFARDHFATRPTLFVGLGRTATRVLQKLRGQMMARFNDVESVPCYGFLAIDTDLRELTEATEAEHSSRLLHDEILDIPLRSTESYREDSDLHLSWISRRWLYNIPKSGKTERLRPLGRLAFIDHLPSIQSKIKKVIERLSRVESVTQSAQTLEANPEPSEFRVYVVASISGGTGSGTVADLAYTIRDQLVAMGMPDDDVNAILIKSTSRNDSQATIETGNALACISELNHFATIEDWPGIPGSNIGSFTEDGATFANTYLFDMGEQLMTDEYETGIEDVAQYLFMNSYESSAAWHDACREDTDSSHQNNEFVFRSFGIGTVAKWTPDEYSKMSQQAFKAAKSVWVNPNSNSKNHSKSTHEEVCTPEESNRIKEKIESAVVELIQQTMDIPSARMLVPKVFTAIEEAVANQKSSHKSLLDICKRCWTDIVETSAIGFGLPERMQESIEQRAEKTAAPLIESIASQLSTPGKRLPGACKHAEQITSTLEYLIHNWKCHIEHFDNQAEPAEQALSAPGTENYQELQPLFNPLLQIKAKRLLNSVCLKMAESSLKRVQKSVQSLHTMGNKVGELLDGCIDKNQAEGDAISLELDTPLKNRWKEKVIQQLDHVIANAELKLPNSLFQSLDLNSDDEDAYDVFAEKVVGALKATIANCVQDLVGNTNLGEFTGQGSTQWLQLPLSASDATLTNCGGQTQRGVIVPEKCGWTSVSADLARERDDEFAVCTCGNDKIVLVCEASGVKANDVFASMCVDHPGASDLVTRIPSRTDVDWTYLASQA